MSYRSVVDTHEMRHLVIQALIEHGGGGGEPAERITDEMFIGASGLGISSLALLQVLVRLEEQLGFTFEDAAVANASFATVGELVGFVSKLARGSGGSHTSEGSA